MLAVARGSWGPNNSVTVALVVLPTRIPTTKQVIRGSDTSTSGVSDMDTWLTYEYYEYEPEFVRMAVFLLVLSSTVRMSQLGRLNRHGLAATAEFELWGL